MHSILRICIGLGFIALLGDPSVNAQSARTPNGTDLSDTRAEAIRDHVDEAEELVDSLLRWRHVVTWSDRGKLEAPPPAGPANTLISVNRADVQKISALVDALVLQVPAAANTSARGDLRAHAEKAKQIARELHPPHAVLVPASGATGELVTLDRAALERLEVELNAMEMLIPRAAK